MQPLGSAGEMEFLGYGEEATKVTKFHVPLMSQGCDACARRPVQTQDGLLSTIKLSNGNKGLYSAVNALYVVLNTAPTRRCGTRVPYVAPR